MTVTQAEKAARFRELHQGLGAFVIANPWGAGSARILEGLGFLALATSSAAFAGTLGRRGRRRRAPHQSSDITLSRRHGRAHRGGERSQERRHLWLCRCDPRLERVHAAGPLAVF
jgi:hypothetical protein